MSSDGRGFGALHGLNRCHARAARKIGCYAPPNALVYPPRYEAPADLVNLARNRKISDVPFSFPFGGRFAQIDPSVFDMVEPDASKRDVQIKALLEWYRENRSSLSWNEEKNCLKVNKKPSKL